MYAEINSFSFEICVVLLSGILGAGEKVNFFDRLSWQSHHYDTGSTGSLLVPSSADVLKVEGI